MNCEAIGHLMDDYLDGELSQRERDMVDEHLSQCYRCMRDLRQRPAFEKGVRRALVRSVQPLVLSPEASSRLVRAAEQSLQRGRWSHRASQATQLVAGMAALCLVVAGILFLRGGLPVPAHLQPIALFPVNQASLSEVYPTSASPRERVGRSSKELPLMSSSEVSMIFEPRGMRPNQPFTITVFVWSADAQPVEAVKLDLDVNGPTGYYRFDLALKEPLPSGGVSVLKVTPELLAEPCQEQYLISPTELFGKTGVYDVRVTMTKPVAAQRRP